MLRKVESHIAKVIVTYACGHTRTLKVLPPTWYIEEVCQSTSCEKCGRYDHANDGETDDILGLSQGQVLEEQ